MPRYQGIAQDINLAPIPGAQIYVYLADGVTLATLTDDAGNPLAQPLVSTVLGVFYFNVATAGAYWLRYRYSGRDYVYQLVPVGLSSDAVFKGPQGDPGPTGPSNNTRVSLALLKSAATSDLTSLYDNSLWTWQTGDYSATPAAALDSIIVKADAVSLSVGAWVRQDINVNLMDFIPVGFRYAIQQRTSTTNVAGYVQNAIDAVAAAGGGIITVPAGRFYCTASFAIKKGVNIVGVSKMASVFYFTSTNGITSTWTLNASTAVYASLRSITIQSPVTNTGVGFWETGGSFISVYDCGFRGWKWQIAFDQTELSDIDLCDFEYDNTTVTNATQGGAAVWLVSGSELTPGSLGVFTNRISINRCQFNGANDFAYGIRDDGGYTHAFRDNNFNGYRTHIWIAGMQTGNVAGGEFEGAVGSSILFSNLSPQGATKGNATTCTIQDTVIVQSGSGASAFPINCISGPHNLTALTNYLAGGSSLGGISVGGSYKVAALNNQHANNYPITYINATTQVSTDLIDGAIVTTHGTYVNTASGKVGYLTGAGGAVTQATSKSTGVTLNTPSGVITLNNASLAAGATVSFTLTNSTILATDIVNATIASGATAASYDVTVDAVANGSCRFSLRNYSGGALGEALVINYALVRGANS